MENTTVATPTGPKNSVITLHAGSATLTFGRRHEAGICRAMPIVGPPFIATAA